MDDSKKTEWLVKDFDSEYIVVVADSWSVSCDGLCFHLNGNKVAHFLKWSSYRVVNKLQEDENGN